MYRQHQHKIYILAYLGAISKWLILKPVCDTPSKAPHMQSKATASVVLQPTNPIAVRQAAGTRKPAEKKRI